MERCMNGTGLLGAVRLYHHTPKEIGVVGCIDAHNIPVSSVVLPGADHINAQHTQAPTGLPPRPSPPPNAIPAQLDYNTAGSTVLWHTLYTACYQRPRGSVSQHRDVSPQKSDHMPRNSTACCWPIWSASFNHLEPLEPPQAFVLSTLTEHHMSSDKPT